MIHATQEIVFMEVNQQRWADMERLFEGRGGPENCYVRCGGEAQQIGMIRTTGSRPCINWSTTRYRWDCWVTPAESQWHGVRLPRVRPIVP